MRKKIILIGFILSFAFLSFVVPNVKASDDELAYAILTNNFEIDFTEPFGIRIEPGAVSLKDFDKLGFVEYSDNTLFFKSKATFSLGLNIYSIYTPGQGFVSGRELTKEAEWLHLLTSRNFGLYGVEDEYNYVAEYKDWDLGAVAATGINGYIPTTFSVVDLNPMKLMDVNGTEFMRTTTFEDTFIGGTYTSVYGSEIFEYNDYWVGDNEASLSAMSVVPDSVQFSTVAGDAAVALSSVVGNLNIGITRGEDLASITSQRGQYNTASENSLISSNGIYAQIIPDIKIFREQLDVRSTRIEVDTKDSLFSAARIYNSPQVSTSTISRNVGWHVKNYLIKYWIEVDFYLYSLAEFSGIVEQASDLGLPNYQIEDMYWDIMITGDTEVTATIGGSQTPIKAAVATFWANWGGMLTWIILLAVLLGGGYLMITFLMKRKGKTMKDLF